MKLWSQLSGWISQHGASVQRHQTSPRRRSVVLRLEQLEDRLVPSGGTGTSSTSGGSGSSGGSSGGPTSVVSTTTVSPTITFTLNISAVNQATGPTLLSMLISGYPVAPSTGPSLSGDMLITDPSLLTSLGNSTVALIPVTSGSGSITTLTLVNTTTGATVDVPVTYAPPPTSGSSGTSGSSASSGSTSGSTTTLPSGPTSGSSGSSGSSSTTSGSTTPSTTV
jgi:hypothetical protein